MHTITVNLDIDWEVWRDPSTGWWIGRCDGLALTASGETYKDAVGEMAEVMIAFFSMLLDEDQLVSFVTSKGGTVEGDVMNHNQVNIDPVFGIKQTNAPAPLHAA